MKETILKTFAEVFGDAEGAKAYFAPGRVNLIGEHTDYNGGHVFPCALTIGTYGVARKRNDNKLRFYSMNFDQLGVIESSLDDLLATDEIIYNKRGLGYFVSAGAKKQIKKTRKKEFMKERLPELARQMQLLDISIDEVKEELEKNLKKIRI